MCRQLTGREAETTRARLDAEDRKQQRAPGKRSWAGVPFREGGLASRWGLGEVCAFGLCFDGYDGSCRVRKKRCDQLWGLLSVRAIPLGPKRKPKALGSEQKHANSNMTRLHAKPPGQRDSHSRQLHVSCRVFIAHACLFLEKLDYGGHKTSSIPCIENVWFLKLLL